MRTNQKLSGPIDLKRVRNLFSVPARTKDVLFLYREIASRMMDRLDLIKLSPHKVLDMGCGVGRDCTTLLTRYPEAHVMGLDASFPALKQSGDKRSKNRKLFRLITKINIFIKSWWPIKKNEWYRLCGDFAQVPLENNSIDLIWSNLALHWHPQPDMVFKEWSHLIRPNGLLMFSCFGPDSFKEVRSAFQGIDDTPHVLPFVDMHDLGDMLIQAGFSTPVIDMEKITVTYQSFDKLIQDVRAFGGNPLTTRRKNWLGKQNWARVRQAFEARKDSEGRLSLSFEIIYGHAFRPRPKVTSVDEHIIQINWPPKNKVQ